MRCDICGKLLRLDFKEVRVDTLYKEYFCRNGHKTIYRRYGMIIDINDRKIKALEPFDLPKAVRLEARKKLVQGLVNEIRG